MIEREQFWNTFNHLAFEAVLNVSHTFVFYVWLNIAGSGYQK